MIHIIYIYFIVNAFIAGVIFNDNKYLALLCLFFGLPLYVLSFFWAWFLRPSWIWLENNSLLLGWYRLYFTDYFSKMDDLTIKIRRQQYFGLRNDRTNANRYQRFFLRQIDKKYNYGITKEVTNV